MKIKVTRNTEMAASGQPLSWASKSCPFPKTCNQVSVPKVGSIACHRCSQCKNWTADFVYCAAGDKVRRREGETA